MSLKHDELQQQMQKVNELMIDNWIKHFIFSTKWWVLLLLSIVPWFLWWKIVDKNRLKEILLYGLFIIIVSTFLDVIGWNYSLWFYPDTLLGLCTPLFPIDYTLLPISYMIAYQYFIKWKPFSIVILVMAFCFAFVIEPLTEVLNLYKTLNWEHFYSFPIYFLIGIFFKWLVSKIVSIEA